MGDHANAIIVEAGEKLLGLIARSVDHDHDLAHRLETEHVGKIEPKRRGPVVRGDDDRYFRGRVAHALTVAIAPAEP
jgi:hypothetical protein